MEWRSVLGYEGRYEVSSCGDIRNVRDKNYGKVLRSWVDSWGYPSVCLYKHGKPQHKRVHRVVAEVFVYPFVGEQVNHIDGNKSNNSVENLEWCNGSQNMSHAYKNGLHKKAKPVKIVELGIVFPSIEDAARHINGKHSGIMRCIKGRNKTHRGYHFELAEVDNG